MRIGLIVTDLSNTRIGGISRVATEVGRNLVDLGHDVTAYVLERKGSATVQEYAGIRVKYIAPFRSLNPDYPVDGFSKRAFQRAVSDHDSQPYDVLHAFQFNGIGLTCFHKQLRERGVPVVVSCYETIGEEVRAKVTEFRSLPSIKSLIEIVGESYLMFRYEKRYLQLADSIVTEDEKTLSALAAMGIDTDKVSLVPSGVDVEQTETTSPPPIDAPWKGRGPVIGYIGRVDARKGVQFLIESMPQVRDEFPDAQLVLAGGSRLSYDAVIKQMIERLNLEGCVHLLGRIEGDILPYYKLMDRIVIPSLSEGIPITLGEAMASEVPVVITKLPGVLPFVKPTDLVHWAELGSADSLAKAIVSSLADPEAEQRCSRALDFIKQYSWRSVAQRHAEVYAKQLR